MSSFLLICPTRRDDRELKRLHPTLPVIRHEYATVALEYIAGAGAPPSPVGDPIEEAEKIVTKVRGEEISGVISTDDYPGCTLACIVAEKLGLPSPSPAANLLCQHKLYSRIAQRALIPEAVPNFAAIDVAAPPVLPAAMPLPVFVKPVKSYLSIGAHVAESLDDIARMQERWSKQRDFFEPFRRLLEAFTPYRLGSDLLLAEELLSGVQVTLEGYALDEAVTIFGIVDSVMYPGTLAFMRFEYPSALPDAVQARLAGLARRFIRGIGYRSGMFNIEFLYDATADRIGLLEVNPRMASQFADLYEKVDGFNSYEVLLQLASGRRPQPSQRQGPYRFAASCVLRRFDDAVVASAPHAATINALETTHPGCRVEVLVDKGRRLSDEMQDDRSYRYAIVNLGGNDREDVLTKFRQCDEVMDFRFTPLNE